eukprot:NODE_2159_length_984_cov_262.453175.p5 GENE.NODE_2159_length_984_cov_262.453175~~NODE_2159_length_984_cov_262.453175.p5  ORF type:complete len:88 (+),score=23.97 NODE_2159_length_984_cov_262.453175:41-265(+)
MVSLIGGGSPADNKSGRARISGAEGGRGRMAASGSLQWTRKQAADSPATGAARHARSEAAPVYVTRAATHGELE